MSASCTFASSNNVAQKKAEEHSSKGIEGECTSGRNDGSDSGKTSEPRAAAEGVRASTSAAVSFTCAGVVLAGLWVRPEGGVLVWSIRLRA